MTLFIWETIFYVRVWLYSMFSRYVIIIQKPWFIICRATDFMMFRIVIIESKLYYVEFLSRNFYKYSRPSWMLKDIIIPAKDRA